MNNGTISLMPGQPYDFPLLLRFLSRWRYPSLDVAHGSAYRRVLRLNGALVLVEVAGEPEGRLAARVLVSQARVDSAELRSKLEWVLTLDGTTGPFWTWARGHSELWPALEPVEGLPLPRTETLFDALVCTVIEQQIAWTAAQRAQRLLCEWGSEKIVYDGMDYYTLPTPERLAAAQIAELKALKITDRRVGVLIRIAEGVASGQIALEVLRDAPPGERYVRLTAIKGVGHWTAVMALARAYGTHPATASNDVALRSAVRLYLPQYAAAADPIAAAFSDCGEFAGPAALYLLSRYVIDRY